MMNQSVTIDLSKAQEQQLASASPLNLWQKRLTILLIVQVLLVIGLLAYQQNSRVQVNAQPLLSVGIADIDRMVIQDASNKATLQKTGDQWQLPELQQLPVDKQKLDDILQKLDGTKLSWPVTTTASSHERFEVSDSKFQRHIELFQGDSKKAELWLGTSPGFKKIHLRRAGEEQVYAVELTSFEFASEAKDWLPLASLQDRAIYYAQRIPDIDLSLIEHGNCYFVTSHLNPFGKKIGFGQFYRAGLVGGLFALSLGLILTLVYLRKKAN